MISEEESIEQIRKGLAELLISEGNNYHPELPEFFQPKGRDIGTRYAFLPRWGLRETRRIAKTDRPHEFLSTPRQRRWVLERGCNTGNELEIASRINHPGLTSVYDYFESETTGRYGLPGAVIIEEYIPDSESLEDRINRDKNGLPADLFSQVASQSASIIRDINSGVGVSDEKGIFHRDLKPSNILLKHTADGIKVMITDLANAGLVDEQKPGYMPTMGGHLVSDPLLLGVFTDKETVYNHSSEVYALASSLIYAARGKPAFEYDPDTGEARAVDSWDDLLEDGKLNPSKHQQALYETVQNLPKKIRKYFSRIFMRGLTLIPEFRYASTKEFHEDIEKAVARYERARPLNRLKRWTVPVAAAAALAVVGGLSLYQVTGLEQKVSDQERRIKLDRYEKITDQFLEGVEGYNTNDIGEYELRGILDGYVNFFHVFDYEKDERLGDKDLAIAAFIESGSDENERPVKVLEAIRRHLGVERLDYDTLKKEVRDLSYDDIRDELKEIDYDLYWRVNWALDFPRDNWNTLERWKRQGEVDDKIRETIDEINDSEEFRDRSRRLDDYPNPSIAR
ncbi:hypothetical protein GF386_05650 [Candidatus Pacearchaeota archaeon]|nr:hypothetical protein [Candidatus Pacearchaeota archaeon]MBD3283579.1 hypothetical protein [Candidatus Pacearchaeota archaeon]